ncbi:hypothetical protein QYE76_025358 [Lolium multiflorum]|uniref:Protein ALP1-like n=1 Tax=Lolium multiflorum TaxID=4521 RepID=A0AAD8RFP3_LOLMU|nr:hypothetical protein QYE76_025358 [Lolium multiflorum]
MVDSDNDYFFIDTSSDERSGNFYGLRRSSTTSSQDPRVPGSMPGRARLGPHKRTRPRPASYNDYFQPKPLFPPALFAVVFGWAYSGHSEGCTVILEDVASHDTWIWHLFFGMAGSHNDINVLQRSPVFDRLAYGQSPDVDFEINGHHYTKGYYLADGIYPPWATLVKTIRKPNSEQEARFAKEQEAARKDVERVFGILQARWAIVRHPARAWDVQTLWEVMTACVIMHNMIVEVERDDSLFDNEWDGHVELVTPQGGPASFQDILHAHREIRDLAVHNQLQADLSSTCGSM